MPRPVDVPAHFQIRDIEVALNGRRYLIPGQPASWWLAILTDEQVDGSEILPGLLSSQDQQELDDLLLNGELEVSELMVTIREIITVASGHPWWWTLNLISVLRSSHGTQLLGELAYLDADKIPFANWLNALYARIVKHMKDQDRTRFDVDLDTPPADAQVTAEEVIDDDANTRSFFAMANQPNG